MTQDLYLEHANITVEDINKAIVFLSTAFPQFHVRGKGESVDAGIVRKWLHFGTDKTYIALEQISSGERGNRKPYRDVGINHLGFVVPNLEEIENRLNAAGYEKSIRVEPHPFRKRGYYFDKSGIEYEFIEYLSENLAERNEYD